MADFSKGCQSFTRAIVPPGSKAAQSFDAVPSPQRLRIFQPFSTLSNKSTTKAVRQNRTSGKGEPCQPDWVAK